MATSVEETFAQNHHHAAPVPAAPLLYQHHHPPFPHQYRRPLQQFLQHPHHHHYHHHRRPHHHHLPPPPFLCARCNCWNFPPNLYFNPHSHPHPGHQHYPHPHPHAHHLTSHPESAESLEAQEFPVADYQTENISSDRFGADEMEVVEEEDYEFVMTDEWMEFFAKSEARRQEKKRQQKKEARDLRKASRARSLAEGTSQQMDEACAI